MPPLPQPGIMNITPYVQGASKTGTNAARIIKLSSNESALGPSPKALDAYQKEAAQLFRYCDGSATLLREAIGSVYQLDPNRIVCGAGSDELIALLIQAYMGKSDETLYSQHGFLMYPISTLKVGGVPRTVPEKNLRTDVQAMVKAVTSKTKIVFIANPNNPTGSYITREELLFLRQNLPEEVLLVIDGAYAEFVQKEGYTAGQDIVDLGENTVMLRTFSKIYGLAGLRIGWAYCPLSIAEVLHRVRGPFNISSAAIAAGKAAVEDTAFTEKAREHNAFWLDWLSEKLAALGLNVAPSVANFILVRFPLIPGKNATAADQFLKEKGIIVRNVTSYGLSEWLRITVGKEEENHAVIEALTEFLTI